MNYKGIIINKKYKIEELCGEGGSSFVYKAVNIKTNKFVAVKLMKDKITTRYIEDVIRFKKEVHIISRLKHPNIIKVYDMGDYNGVPYIVTEFLTGESLAELLRSGKKFSIDESMQIFKQLIQVVEYVHSKTIIHRDIKPGNIFIENKEGNINVKLLDFGVANILQLGELNGQDKVVGTFGYMSPEATGILINRRVDERSDLYSLGVVFYAMLTGKPPFRGKDINKLIHQQLALMPEELYKVRRDVPYSLSEVIMKLLLKDPDLRYQSATGLLSDINKIMEGDYTFKPGDDDFKVKLTYNTSIIGREEELRQAKSLLESVRDGNSKMLLVSGEAGSGKTSFVYEISKNVYENNGLFLNARCIDQKNKMPYQLFKELINEYIRHIEGMEPKEFKAEVKRLREITEPFGEIFINLNSSIGKYLKNVQKLDHLEPERENQRLLMVLANFFINLPLKNEVVLFLDDLQWVDEGSLSLLDEILRRMGNEKLFIVGTYRNEEVAPGHGLLDLKMEAKKRNYPLYEIHLDELDFDEINRLMASILGEKEGNVKKLTTFIYRKTRGNPFFSINLLRELVEKGAVSRQKDLWSFDENKLRSISVSENMIETILKRINKLTKEQIDVLIRAAVIGREVNISVLYGLVDIDINDFIEMLYQFITMQLMEKIIGKRSLLFVHDRIRETFFQMVDDEKRREIHKSIAEVIEKEAAEDKESVLFELVHHYVEAGDEEKMKEYLIPAADKAKESYGNEEAVKYYNMGAELLKKKEGEGNKKWIDCCSKLVDVYLTMGKNNEAIELLEEMLKYVPEKIERARIYKRIGRAYFKKGTGSECEKNFAKSLALLGERIPKSRLEWELKFLVELVIHMYRSTFLGDFKEKVSKPPKEKDMEIISAYLGLNWYYMLSNHNKLKGIVLRMLNMTEARLQGTDYLGTCLSGYAAVIASIGLFKRSMKYQRKAIKLRKEIGEKWGVAQSYQFLGFAYSWRGEHDKSIEAFQKAVDMFSEVGDMWELGMVLSGSGYGYRYTSRYKEGIDVNRRYFDVSKKIKNTYGVISAHIELAFCFLESGNFDEAERNLKSALELNTEDNRDYYLYCCTLICKGYMEFVRGDYDKAIKTLEEAKHVEENNSFIKDYTINVHPYYAEVLIKRTEKRFVFR